MFIRERFNVKGFWVLNGNFAGCVDRDGDEYPKKRLNGASYDPIIGFSPACLQTYAGTRSEDHEIDAEWSD